MSFTMERNAATRPDPVAAPPIPKLEIGRTRQFMEVAPRHAAAFRVEGEVRVVECSCEHDAGDAAKNKGSHSGDFGGGHQSEIACKQCTNDEKKGGAAANWLSSDDNGEEGGSECCRIVLHG